MNIELPPLSPLCIFVMNRDFVSMHCVNEREASREARERILMARIAELQGQLSAALEAHDSVHDALSSAMKENAELEADAERYRWLREKSTLAIDLDGSLCLGHYRKSADAKSKLDAAIDAARGKA